MINTASELRREARAALGENGQYWRCVSAYLLLSVMAIAIMTPLLALVGLGIAYSGIAPYFTPGGKPEPALFADPEVMLPLLVTALVFSLLVIYPLGFIKWAQTSFPMAVMRRGIKLGHAFSGWGHGWKMGWIEMVKYSYISLWSLLFVIPGIVKSFSYAMTEFLAVDHPDWSANQCISESRRLMKGNKLRLFLLYLSFAGWWLMVIFASALVPFVGNCFQFLFIPYPETAVAAFYEELLDADEVTSFQN
jgi:uncharacterized membrane protein